MNQIDNFTFNGMTLNAITHEGRKAIISRQLGEALGYSRGKRLNNYLTNTWSHEFVEGVHYTVIGMEAIRALNFEGTVSVPSKARKLTLLFEEGVNLVLLKTNRPAGVELRRFLAETLFPNLARGNVSAPRQPLPDLEIAKLERDVELAKIQATVEVARINAKAAEMHAEAALLEAKASLMDSERLLNGAGGDPINPAMEQPVDYLRQSQIAEILGFPLSDAGRRKTHQVAKALRGLNAYGISGLSSNLSRKCITEKAEGGRYPGYCYHRSLVPLVRSWLSDRGLLPRDTQPSLMN